MVLVKNIRAVIKYIFEIIHIYNLFEIIHIYNLFEIIHIYKLFEIIHINSCKLSRGAIQHFDCNAPLWHCQFVQRLMSLNIHLVPLASLLQTFINTD